MLLRRSRPSLGQAAMLAGWPEAMHLRRIAVDDRDQANVPAAIRL